MAIKRMIICLAIGSWFGSQAGYKVQVAVNSNPITKFAVTGKL